MPFLSFSNPRRERFLFYGPIGSLLQFIVALLFLYYSCQEGNRFYCLVTGRKGVLYLLEDGWKLVTLSHRETTETEWTVYGYQLATLAMNKLLQKMQQHFTLCTTHFAQQAVAKYTEHLLEICSPRFHMGLEKGGSGWMGWMEPILRMMVRPTAMSYCVLESNRLFNSFLAMEMEKHLYQCKINLIVLSSTGVLGVSMGYRALSSLIRDRVTLSAPLTASVPAITAVQVPPLGRNSPK